MAYIWTGSDPTGVVETANYELGTVVCCLQAASLTGIRVWSPANAVNKTARRGHVWAMDGTLLATITMTDSMTSGWTTHSLATPLSLSPGDFRVISYETAGNYGATSAALANGAVSADSAMCMPASKAVLVGGSLTTGNGRYKVGHASAPDSSVNATFYGVDAVYTPASGTAPTLSGLALSASGLTVTAVITASDPDGLTSATYAVDWGDGNTSSGSSATLTHTYTSGGIKSVLASVTDSTGLKACRSGAISILADTAPTILQIMQGLESLLDDIGGLRTSEYVTDAMNFPMAVVGIPEVPNYRQTFGRGRFEVRPQIYVLVSAALDRVGQAALAGYANPTGATSIISAIETDPTLGGVVETCVVDSFRPLGMEEVGLIQAYGGVFELRVIARGA